MNSRRGSAERIPSSWRAFAWKVRGRKEKLLERLDEFPDSVLVTGCQRSGGTMLSRVITESEGMTKFWFSNDEELDAALILAGVVPHAPVGRYCFQTTYLNERVSEYRDHLTHRLIWTLRNPYSVVYSMVNNWRRFALNELFLQCGYGFMNYVDRIRFQRFGLFGIPAVRKASYAYVGKVSQLFFLKEFYPDERLTVLEYDALVRGKSRILPRLYQRIDVTYKSIYCESISERSLSKQDRLRHGERVVVQELAEPIYERALSLVNLH